MNPMRPTFNMITSYEEFLQYYWYREELVQICKGLGLEYQGTKPELNHIIEAYFAGQRIEHTKKKCSHATTEALSLDTPLLACGFAFNAKFREYFSTLTGDTPFKFTADMATAWRKVKAEQDTAFTIADLLRIYYGDTTYARYDASSCQWNQFLKDFCASDESNVYSNKLQVAAMLWNKVRDSKDAKVYSPELLERYGADVEGMDSHPTSR